MILKQYELKKKLDKEKKIFLFYGNNKGLIEETIINRKPKYKKYIQSTNSILPWLPKES